MGGLHGFSVTIFANKKKQIKRQKAKGKWQKCFDPYWAAHPGTSRNTSARHIYAFCLLPFAF
jgi:hypothetical protein